MYCTTEAEGENDELREVIFRSSSFLFFFSFLFSRFWVGWVCFVCFVFFLCVFVLPSPFVFRYLSVSPVLPKF